MKKSEEKKRKKKQKIKKKMRQISEKDERVKASSRSKHNGYTRI